MPSRHTASVPPESTTWSTGQSLALNGVSAAWPGRATANPVAFSTTAVGASARSSESVAAATGSFRLVT